MKPATRLGTLVASVGQKPTVQYGFVCLHCQHPWALAAQKGALSTSIPIPTQRRASSTSGSIPFTEKIRRKIWGTDNPPGQEDPYEFLSIAEQRRAKDKTKKDPVALAEAGPEAGVVPPDATASNYVPATTWDGLEQIGGATGWWEEAWDNEHPFHSFMGHSKITSRDQVAAAVRRAVIEVFTLQDAERPLTDAVNATDNEAIPNFENVVFSESDDASVVLDFLNTQVRQDILDSMDSRRRGPAQEVLETPPTQEASKTGIGIEVTDPDNIIDLNAMAAASSEESTADEELAAHQMGELDTSDSTVTDSRWQNVSFGDSDVKFAVLKRVMQLTGVRIPDYAIRDINTAKALVGHLVKKPKPKKLAESLLVNEKLTALPNLQIFDRRYTPIDREKEVGRWKVIEKELVRRGLPVTGTA